MTWFTRGMWRVIQNRVSLVLKTIAKTREKASPWGFACRSVFFSSLFTRGMHMAYRFRV